MKLNQLQKESLKREFPFLKEIYPFNSHQDIQSFKIKRIDENVLRNVPHTWGNEDDINGSKKFFEYYFIKDGVIADHTCISNGEDDSLLDIIFRCKIDFDNILQFEYEFNGDYNINFVLFKSSKNLNIDVFIEKLISEYRKEIKNAITGINGEHICYKCGREMDVRYYAYFMERQKCLCDECEKDK